MQHQHEIELERQAERGNEGPADLTPQPAVIAYHRSHTRTGLQPQGHRTTKGGERARSKLICTQHQPRTLLLHSNKYECHASHAGP